MKKVGTVTTAGGLIYLGLWMIVMRNNQSLADEMVKWWPIIIIALGVEVLICYKRNLEEKRLRLNLMIIPLIIVFLGVNVWNGSSYRLSGFNGNWFTFGKFNSLENINIGNYKEIDATKTLNSSGGDFAYKISNGTIRLYRSTDNKIKLITKVYVDSASPVKNYDINAVKTGEGFSVDMTENDIKKVDADLYVPDTGILSISTDSSNIRSSDSFAKLGYKIDTSSSNIDLNGGTQLVLNIDSGTMKVKDIKQVQIKGSSGTIRIAGAAENIDTSLDSGTISIDNDVCKNVQLDLNSGMVNLNTKDKNVNVNTSLDSGICTINGERRVNSGFNKTIGNGAGSVTIKLDSGTIKFSSQE